MIEGGTWTYSGDPAASDLDAVRFLVGDTDSRRQLVSDEEITWALADAGNRYSAAAVCCRAIGTFAEAAGSVTVGDMSITGGRDAAGWMALAEEYERRSALQGSPPSPIFGGASLTRRDTVARDTDRRPPTFYPFQFTRSTGSTWMST